MTCNHRFRTNNPHKVLRALFNEQCKVEPAPQQRDDFVTLRSRELFTAAGLPISDSAKYNILTKLCVSGLLSVHSDPDHKQAVRYSITLQGMQCQQCYRYQDGIEAKPKNFRCGAVSVDTLAP